MLFFLEKKISQTKSHLICIKTDKVFQFKNELNHTNFTFSE
jgi:hypothetical protein